MLMDVIMESLLSMDDETLDYVLESCDDEELGLINDAMESISEKDREDFKFINKIQRYATSKGWGNIAKEDRDKFVDIMSNTENLDLLKKAVKIGKREGGHDSEVRDAMKALGTGAVGAGIGTLAARGAINKAAAKQAENNESLRQMQNAISTYDAAQNGINRKIGELKNFIASAHTNGNISQSDIANAKRDLVKLSSMSEKLAGIDGDRISSLRTAVNSYGDVAGAKLSQMQGTAIGAGIGVGVGAGLAAIKSYKKYDKDRKDVIEQGDSDHPDKRWKQNRKNDKLRAKFSGIRRDALTADDRADQRKAAIRSKLSKIGNNILD